LNVATPATPAATRCIAKPSPAPITKTEIWPPLVPDYDAFAKLRVRCSVRASLYNAVTEEDVNQLLEFMTKFRARHEKKAHTTAR